MKILKKNIQKTKKLKSDNTESNYAKFITLDACKKLNEKGYKLLLFNINSK